MRHLLAIVACLAVTGSAVDAAPRHARHAKVAKKAKAKAKVTHRKKAAPPAKQHVAIKNDDDDDIESDDDEIEIDETPKTDETDETEEVEEVDAAVTTHAVLRHPKKWHIALGPYLWASSVDAKVLLGSESVGAAVDFFQMTKHAKYGIPLLLEARYGRFSLVGDMMYGVIGRNGMKELGPVMVQLDAEIKNLAFDGASGVTVLGNSDSKLALEARAGVRYQRTVIAGSLGTAEMPSAPIGLVTSTTDWLAGARVFVRPSHRIFFTGQADVGLFGDSARTWSAAADASVRVPYALISVGYRTMTTDSPYVSLVMHGPRIAIQASF